MTSSTDCGSGTNGYRFRGDPPEITTGRRLRAATALSIAIAGGLSGASAKAAENLALAHQTLHLPGPPSAIVDTDLDGDGDLDLAVVVAYTEIEQIGFDRVEGMVQITTVVPAVFDRREVHAFLRAEDGSYHRVGAPLPLDDAVLSLEAGPADWPLAAVTEEGLAKVALAPAEGGPRLVLEPILSEPSILAGSGSFFPRLRVVHDLDGDGTRDVLFPARSGPAVFRAVDGLIEGSPTQRIEALGPKAAASDAASSRREYAFPEVRDVDGDGHPDLVARSSASGEAPIHLLRGDGAGRFREIRAEPADCWDLRRTGLRWTGTGGSRPPWPEHAMDLRDLDGDGRAELITRDERERGGGFRKEMKDAKRPIHLYGFHELGEQGLGVEVEPYFAAEVEGHVFEDGPEELSFEAFDDLDGDGREDLVTVTLDFSVFQALRILTTKRVSIGVDFHVWCQEADGSFRAVQGLDLSEKLKFDLNDLSLGRFAQFAGDFDGDGRKDFVHLGRGRRITIHRGASSCRYPRNADLVIELEEEPLSLELVRVRDLDGDGRADITVTRPLEPSGGDSTSAVALDLYLSGGGS